MVLAQSERLRIREFEESDIPFLFELFNSPEWLKMLGNRGIKNLKATEQYLKNTILKSYQVHQYGFYLVESLQDSTPIGLCGIILRNNQEIPDLGFGTLPQYVGNGFMFEAATLVLNYVKRTFSFDKLDAFTAPDNLPSQKLLEKLGFHFLEEIFHPEFLIWVKHYRLELK